MQLTDQEKEEIKSLIERGEPLPHKFRLTLFKEPHEAELIWPGKTHEVTKVVLPFQSIEQIDEPRAETAATGADLFTLDRTTGRQSGGWTNKLIWGDNKLVLSSLKHGPLRREIESAGGLKLVYIDPPFDVGTDFSFTLEVGGELLTKEPSVLEDVAYRDTWGRGADSYLSMMYERLTLIKNLMHSDGSIYVHCDWRMNSALRLLLDEVFVYFENQISWKRSAISAGVQTQWRNSQDFILFYSVSGTHRFTPQFGEYSESSKKHYNKKDGKGTFRVVPLMASGRTSGPSGQPWRGVDVAKRGKNGMHWLKSPSELERLNAEGLVYWNSNGVPELKYYLDEAKGVYVSDFWDDIDVINSMATEYVNYQTQKPESLLNRIVNASSREGDLVADFFCGSGTALAVAEKLGRKWIGCDLGRFAIHTSRKRLIDVQRDLKAAGKPYRSFEILNLGKYERQYFVGIDHTLPEKERAALSAQKEEHYVSLILFAYKAERVFQSPPFHGRRGSTFVVVGPLDAPVTRYQIEEAVEACRKLKASRLDVLGFEFEMGLNPQCVDNAKAKGVSLALRYIPKEVFDKRAVDKNQVVFYDVAYVEIQPAVKGRKVTLKLKDFGVSYRQDDVDALAGEMKAGTKVTVADGQVVKITKDKKGIVKRELLTKKWEDWIDYWAVDFDFTRRPETIVVTLPDATGRMVDRPQRTGGFIFENEWQSFRTRHDRKLELESAPFEYAAKGKYKIAVKVIDIFGNDTTKVVEVSV